ncbi:DUF4184 family protein [Segetibacter koreensis]|uniref:DUF4184 family protein n=1 Tax=Segetibacter koreensis TaxID=398037 RepID=UPI00037F1118|nr:DUF4184 family protein [Segetibacter koreensis]
MPFTFSHPAAVLPLSLIPKKWISVTGLVIGSITPDFEYFFRMQHDSVYSHTWAGIFWFDLPLGLLLVYLFNYLIRKEFIENLPVFLNRRFSKFTSFTRNLNSGKEFLFLTSSLVIGILSHLIWDKLTHKTVHIIDQQEHYSVFWEANSLVGAAVIALLVLNMPKGKNTQKSYYLFFWLPVFVITLAAMYFTYLSTSDLQELGIAAIVGFFIGSIVTCIFQKVKNKRFIRIA